MNLKICMYDRIKNVYKNESGFPKRFKVMYEDKDMEEYVDLDSPIQLMDRKSNKLYIKSEDEGSKENSNEKASPRYDKFQNYIINLIFFIYVMYFFFYRQKLCSSVLRQNFHILEA